MKVDVRVRDDATSSHAVGQRVVWLGVLAAMLLNAVGLGRIFASVGTVLVLPAAVIFGAWMWRTRRGIQPGTLSIADGRLVVKYPGAKLDSAVTDVSNAWILDAEDGRWLRIERGRRAPVTLRPADPEDAAAVAEQLGYAPQRSRRRYEIRRHPWVMGHVWRWLPRVVVPIALLSFPWSRVSPVFTLSFVVALILFGLAVLAVANLPAHVEIGLAGVRYQESQGPEFYVRFRNISEVTVEGIKVRLHGDLNVWEFRIPDAAQRLEVVSRIQDEIVKGRPDTASVARRAPDDSVRQWRQGIEKHRAEYREKAVHVDALEAIVSAPRVSDEERLGAALLLRAVDASRARVRVAQVADQVVHPKLRVALEAVAEGTDEDALDEALEHALGEAKA